MNYETLVTRLRTADPSCLHANTPARAHHCPDCFRTLRRCCLSALGEAHRWGCAAEPREETTKDG